MKTFGHIVGGLKRRSKASLIAGGVFLILLVSLLDSHTPAKMSFAPFYLIPVLVTTWYVGRSAGFFFALMSAVMWSAVDLAQSTSKEALFVAGWNVISRLGVFLVVVFLLHAIKKANEDLECSVEKRTAELLAKIAEHQRLENLLRESELRFRQVTESIREVFWMTDTPKNQMLYVSPGYEEIWGRSCESLYAAPHDWINAIHHDDRDRVRQAALKQPTGEYDVEYRIVRSDGTIRWIRDRAFPIRDENGKVYRVAGIAEDVTERKQADAQLTTLAHAVESTSELICITDLQDRLVFVNHAFEKVHGYTQAEILGKTPEILYSPRNPPTLLPEVLRQTRLGGWRGEILDRRKDGTEFPIRLSTSLVKDQTGQVIGLLGVAQDITERKLAEERMMMLAHAVESTSELICLADLHNHFTFANLASQKAYGYTEAEILGQTPDLIFSPDNPPSLAAELLEQTRRGGWRGELLNRRKDGTEFPIHLTTSLLKDQLGQVIGFMGVAQDITDRKRAEQSLRLLGSAVQQSNESIVITDAELDLPGPRILFVNPAFTKMTGYTANEVLGKTPRILQGPRSDRATLRKLRQTLARGESFLGQIINYRKDGTEFYLEWQVTPIRDADGAITHFVAIQRDVTDRKRAEARMAMLAHAVESTSELIAITDLQDRFSFVNRAFLRAYGYEEREILGRTPHILYSPKNPPTLVTEILTQTRSGGWQGEVLDRGKDGTEFPIFLTTSQVVDESGHVLGLMGVARDITERKRLEREILEISDREQGRIGQDLHDGLCQQLVSTTFACNLLSQKLAKTAPAEADTAREISGWLDEAISQARALARGLYPVKLEADGLTSALQELAEYVDDRFGIICVLESPKPVLLADNAVATHLYRIAQEAVTNAVKHSRANRIVIRLTSEGGNSSVRIEDDGGGIPDGPANGMGLHIMQYRARMLGGALEIKRGSNGGTVVVCSFQQETPTYR